MFITCVCVCVRIHMDMSAEQKYQQNPSANKYIRKKNLKRIAVIEMRITSGRDLPPARTRNSRTQSADPESLRLGSTTG